MRLLTAAALVPLLCSAVMAKTLHVSPTGSGTDGLSWETAFATVHAAMLAASTGDHVWVRSATYAGNIQMTTGVSLFGGFAGTETLEEFHLRDWDSNPTVLSGGTHVVTVADETVFDGFVVRDGVADAPGGGGIFISEAQTTIANCLITNNMKVENMFGEGGVVYCWDATVTILNCTVHSNRLTGNLGARGAGIAFERSFGILKSSTISQNFVRADGGGLSILDSFVLIEDCRIIDNQAESLSSFARGGGVFSSNSRIILDRCVIARNVARGSSPFGPSSDGGALYSLADVDATLTNCLFEGNDALRGTAVTVGSRSDFTVDSCTFVRQTSDSGNGQLIDVNGGGQLHMFNSIVNSNDVESNFPSGLPSGAVTHSNIQGGFVGAGNIDQDPLFVDPDNGNFRLQSGSPCIDSASTNGPSTDLDGNSRPFDVPGVGRDGPGAFDMGAYEFIAPTPAPTLVNDRSDINRSGEVNAFDLLILIADWKKSTGAI